MEAPPEVTEPTPIEEATFDRMLRHVTAEDIEAAYGLWVKLCGLAGDFGVNTMDDLAACVLVLAERHPNYAAFRAAHGGGFRV